MGYGHDAHEEVRHLNKYRRRCLLGQLSQHETCCQSLMPCILVEPLHKQKRQQNGRTNSQSTSTYAHHASTCIINHAPRAYFAHSHFTHFPLKPCEGRSSLVYFCFSLYFLLSSLKFFQFFSFFSVSSVCSSFSILFTSFKRVFQFFCRASGTPIMWIMRAGSMEDL